jgi:hypothetical protein
MHNGGSRVEQLNKTQKLKFVPLSYLAFGDYLKRLFLKLFCATRTPWSADKIGLIGAF